MIRGELAHGAIPDEIEAGIAYMADNYAVFINYCQGEDAGHAAPVFILLSEIAYAIVGGRNGAANAMPRVAAVGFKLGADYFERSFRGFLAGCVATEAVDYQEDAEGVVDIAAVLILGAQAAGVGECGGAPFGGNAHVMASWGGPPGPALRNIPAGRRGRRPRTRGSAPRIVASRKETDGQDFGPFVVGLLAVLLVVAMRTALASK